MEKKGLVVSVKDKTASVVIEMKSFNRRYKKTLSRSKRMQVADNIGLEPGEIVTIKPTSPISKKKSWIAVEKHGTQKIKVKKYANS
jgi:ribosomal protein S17